MPRSKQPPIASDETLALGKICGCNECEYCRAVEVEAVWAKMAEDVSKAIAEADATRKQIINELRNQHEQANR